MKTRKQMDDLQTSLIFEILNCIPAEQWIFSAHANRHWFRAVSYYFRHNALMEKEYMMNPTGRNLPHWHEVTLAQRNLHILCTYSSLRVLWFTGPQCTEDNGKIYLLMDAIHGAMSMLDRAQNPFFVARAFGPFFRIEKWLNWKVAVCPRGPSGSLMMVREKFDDCTPGAYFRPASNFEFFADGLMEWKLRPFTAHTWNTTFVYNLQMVGGATMVLDILEPVVSNEYWLSLIFEHKTCGWLAVSRWPARTTHYLSAAVRNAVSNGDAARIISLLNFNHYCSPSMLHQHIVNKAVLRKVKMCGLMCELGRRSGDPFDCQTMCHVPSPKSSCIPLQSFIANFCCDSELVFDAVCAQLEYDICRASSPLQWFMRYLIDVHKFTVDRILNNLSYDAQRKHEFWMRLFQ